MNVSNVELARQRLNELESLRLEVARLRKEHDYLPKEYDRDEVKKQMDLIDDEIIKCEEAKEKLERLNESGELIGEEISYDSLDTIIHELEKLNQKADNYEKYKSLNENIERVVTEAIIVTTEARNDLFSEIFNDSLDENTSVEKFINMECIRNSRIGKPFMVALLTTEPDEIYNEVINGSRYLTEEQKVIIATYINMQKKRINKNLILSDSALINLLESNTGRNIMREEQINDRYKFYCDQFCYRKFNKSMLETIIFYGYTPELIINAFSDIPEYKKMSEKDKRLIKQRLEYSASKTPQELLKELDESRNRRRLIDKSNGLVKEYEILTNVNNRKHTIGGDQIKKFSEKKDDTVEFLRTIDDMRVSNFPTGDVEDYIFEVFSSDKVPKEFKENLIAIVLDNLKMCYDLFKSYYKNNSIDITTYLNMSSGDTIELNYSFNEENVPHILGIPPTNEYVTSTKSHTGTMKLPQETMDFLGIHNCSAINVLEAILENRDKIIECCGVVRREDGLLYEMLPWEKIILKTNAFLRGDFFKTTSYISSLNPLSYMFSPSFDSKGNLIEDVNAVSLNSTLFNRSIINQPPTDVFQKSPLVKGEKFARRFNTVLERDKDYILKGLIAAMENDRITRIKSVKTNEIFMGQRIKTTDGTPVRSLNKLLYMLQNVKPEQGGIITSVENLLGQKEYSIDEMILLVEDMSLSFGNEPHIIEILNVVLDQIVSLGQNISKRKN